MSKMYEYQGRKFQLPDNLSDAQAKEKILNHLGAEKKAEKPEIPKTPQAGLFEGAEREVSTDSAALSDQEQIDQLQISRNRNEEVYDPTEHEGVPLELIEGVASGIIGIGQGIGELVGAGIDLVADTDIASYVTDGANEIRSELGIDPVGVVGKGAEVLTQFALPGIAAIGVVSKGSKVARMLGVKKGALAEGTTLGKAGATARAGGQALTSRQKYALLAQEAAAAGAADFVVASDGTATIGDFFEGGPTQTSNETGLQGREEALRRLGNKMSFGLEAAGITAAVPPLLGMLGAMGTLPIIRTGTTAEKKAIREGVTPVTSRYILDKAGKIGSYMKEIEAQKATGEQMGLFKSSLANAASALRYRGFLPDEVADVKALIEGGTQAEIRQANIRLNKIQQGLEKSLSKYAKEGAEDSNLARQDFFNKLEDFLTAETPQKRTQAVKNLPDWARSDATAIRKQVDNLSNDMLNSDYIKALEGKTNKKGQDLAELARTEIHRNMGSYLRRRYEAFENSKYTVSKENMKIGVAGFKRDIKQTEYELNKILESGRKTRAQLGLTDEGKLLNAKVSDKQARFAAENFLTRKVVANRAPVKSTGLGFGERALEYRVDTKMFLNRARIKDYQRALLGEIKDPREQVLGTVADLAEFKAVDKYFGKIREMADPSVNPGVAKMFIDTNGLTKQGLKDLAAKGYRVLGSDSKRPGQSPWGSLEGYAVSEPVYNQMTRAVLADEGVIPSVIRATYGNFLKLKGGSQYAKTVLSPTTQVRNVTTAASFALANGNIGRGANMLESIRLTLDDIRKMPSEAAAAELKEIQQLGVISSQAELREIQDLISKGVGLDAKQKGRQFGSKFTDSTVGSILKGAENMYQGGDNIWKIYSYKFELNKLKNALRDAPLDEQVSVLSRGRIANAQALRSTGDTVESLFKQEAARIVRDTVPNYNMVPQIIKELRRLPTGNFIAFPAEIVRTGTNIVARALDEMASTNVNIQRIGQRRMAGFLTTTTLMPIAASKFAHEVSGVTEEQMQAYQRSMAPEWEKNARLLPVSIDEEGNIKYVNFSYSNPYDMLERIAIGAMNKYEETKGKGGSTSAAVTWATNQALGEFFRPFTEESIALGALRDVLDPETEILGLRQVGQLVGGRAGKTISGAKVYNEEDALGTKAAKSLTHVFGTMIPGGVPVDVRGGELEPSRLARSMIAKISPEGLAGMSPKDRQGLERELTQELARAITGVAENSADVPLGLKYKGYEFSGRRTNSSNILNTVARRGNVTSDELVDAYKAANEARYRAYKDFHQVVKDMRTIGFDDSQIRSKLKEANVGDIDSILMDSFTPIEVGDSVRQEMMRNGTYGALIDAEIELLDYKIDQRFREYPDEKEASSTVPGSLSQAPQPQPVAATTPPPVVAQAGATPAPSVAPATSIVNQQELQQQLVGGGNPINAAKNTQISRTV